MRSLFYTAVLVAASASSDLNLLYNNDLVNTEGCVSPWHKHGAPFSLDLIANSVNETRPLGVAVHLLAPDLCWVSWWNLTALKAHNAWWTTTFRRPLPTGTITDWIIQRDGAQPDLLGAFISDAHAAGEQAFLSWRMQDVQFVRQGFTTSSVGSQNLAKFWYDHRLDPAFMAHGPFNASARGGAEPSAVMDWGNSEVVAFHQRLLETALGQYAWDGVELDCWRSAHFFNVARTPPAARQAVMAAFIAAARARLRRPGARLGLRLPPSRAVLDRLGINTTALRDAKLVDYFNFGQGFYTFQPVDSDFAELAQALAATETPVLYEVTHTHRDGPIRDPSCAESPYPRERMTKERIATTAHAAFQAGATGLSAFNYAYWRAHGPACYVEEGSPWGEPPFETLAAAADPAWAARQDQLWFLTSETNGGNHLFPLMQPQLPKPMSLEAASTVSLTWILSPPATTANNGGALWPHDGRLRVSSDYYLNLTSLTRVRLTATLNGVALAPTANVSRPYPSEVPSFWPMAAYLAWTVPASVPVAGRNTLTLATVPVAAKAEAEAEAEAEAATAPTAAAVVGIPPPPPKGIFRMWYADLALPVNAPLVAPLRSPSAPNCTAAPKQKAIYLKYSFSPTLQESPATDITAETVWTSTTDLRRYGHNGIYAAHPVGTANHGVSGYFGSQVDGDPTKGGLLFSMWDRPRRNVHVPAGFCDNKPVNHTWCMHKHAFPRSPGCHRHCLDCGLHPGWHNTTGTQCGVSMRFDQGDAIRFRMHRTAANVSLTPPGMPGGLTYRGSEWTVTATVTRSSSNASNTSVAPFNITVGSMFFEDTFEGIGRFGAFHEHIGCTPCAAFFESEVRRGPWIAAPVARTVGSIAFHRLKPSVECQLYEVNITGVEAQIATGPGTRTTGEWRE